MTIRYSIIFFLAFINQICFSQQVIFEGPWEYKDQVRNGTLHTTSGNHEPIEWTNKNAPDTTYITKTFRFKDLEKGGMTLRFRIDSMALFDTTSNISVIIIGTHNKTFPIYVNLPLSKSAMYPSTEQAINIVVDTPVDSMAIHFMLTGRSAMRLSKVHSTLTQGEYTKEWQRQYAQRVEDPSFRKQLAVMGKVWGLLKYHGPNISNDDMDWDQVLIHSLDSLFGSNTKNNSKGIIDRWLQLAYPDTAAIVGKTIRTFTDAERINIDDAWIEQNDVLDGQTRSLLSKARNHYQPFANKYVATWDAADERISPRDGAAQFFEEKRHGNPVPTANERILMLFRYWNIIQYYYPYKYTVADKWDTILEQMIPVFVNATTGNAYGRALLRLNAAINDAHTALPCRASTVTSTVFNGFTPMMPVKLRVLNGEVYVKQVSPAFQAATGLQKGSRILKINNRPIAAHIALLAEHISTGRDDVLEHIINGNEVQGELLSYMPVVNDSIRLVYLTDSVQQDVGFRFDPSMFADAMKLMKDAKKPSHFAAAHKGVWRVNDTTLYLNSGYWEKQFDDVGLLKNVKKLIIDMRDRPKANYNWNFLFKEQEEFVRFSMPIRVPGYVKVVPQAISPNKDYLFSGKVVVLVSENSKSYPETVTMQLKAGVEDAVFIGRNTCGSNGNVTWIPVVGVNKYKLAFSGARVMFPNGTETQNVGIAPDIEVKRTLEELLRDQDVILKQAISL
ncbi:S41 family peptidase [Parapedobacter tibetensis]|uniref:S41 family peptidase n=1 Tax=Parapedobacter tibetensis TaxID=2972951 RepID=UPI00214D7A6E|nr:S41 family peptidase [Parapedobacter tibetensis]